MLPPLDWLRSFERAASLLNFTAAGRDLGLTQAAVSQHIKMLEAELDKPLFRRLRRGVELTAEGAAYLPHVQGAFEALGRSTEALFGPERHRTISLCGPISFMTLWFAPRLPRLQVALPRLRLALSTMHVPADYATAGTDFDIRFGKGSFAGRTSHRLSAERLVPMAAPHLLDDIGSGFGWTSLPLLSVVGAREMWPDWFAAATLPSPMKPFLQCDSFIVAYQAARQGAGVLLGSRALGHAAIRDGSLKALSTIELSDEAGHFLTHAAGRRLNPDEAGFVDFLLDEVTANDA